MKRRSKNPEPAQRSDPARLDFPAWRKRFDQLLGSREPSWRALRKWIESTESIRRSQRIMWESDPRLKSHMPPHVTDARTEALQSLYRETCPPRLEEKQARVKRRKNLKSTLSALDNMATQAEGFARRLRDNATQIEAEGGRFSVNLTPIAESYERAAIRSRYVLSLLRRPYTHDATLVSQCAPLFLTLTDDFRVTEPEAVGLLKIALLAHGYREEDLKGFAPRSGTLRKHAQDALKAFLGELADEVHRRGKYSRAVLQPIPIKGLSPR